MTSPGPSAPSDASLPDDATVVRLDAVRARLAAPEEIDMGGVPVAGDTEGGAGEAPAEDWGEAGDPGWDALPDGPPDGPPPEGTDPDVPSPAARCADLPLNDLGNAQRLIEHFGEDLLYVPRVGWFTWTGQVWAVDPDLVAVTLKAQKLGDLILAEIPHIRPTGREAEIIDAARMGKQELMLLRLKDRRELEASDLERMRKLEAEIDEADAIRKRFAKRRAERASHARASGNKAKTEAAIAQMAPIKAVPLDALDADPLMINVENGVLVVRVEEEGEGAARRRYASVELVPHSREQWLTKIMPVAWTEGAEAPRYGAFLDRIQPDPGMRAFLRRWYGLSLTALTGEQKLVFQYGGGANGKSVLADTMGRILGAYAATAKIESLTGRNRRSGGDATPDLVPLIGARMVRASEPEEGERLQEGRIKELTGGEPILVRALNEDFIEVRPRFKLTISGNHRPEIRGNDDGIWRRVLLVPFDVQIPKAERDPLLGDKLWAEREGILQWLVAGLLDYLEGGLREPETVLEATAEYRDESDPLGRFLLEACVITGVGDDTIRTAELTDAFNYWLMEAGVSQWKGSTIQRQLGAMSRHWKHPATGLTIRKAKSNLSQYEGLRLTDTFRRRFDNAPKDAAGRRVRPGAAEGGSSDGGDGW